jgi:hypothetical protein
MTDNRLDQIRILLADAETHGDPDDREILKAELLNSGIPIEETIHLLDLASCVVTPDRRIRRANGASRRVPVHSTRASATHKQQRKSWAASRSLERFINKQMRPQNER